MTASFVKEVTFQLRLEAWGGFSQAAGVGGGPLQAPGESNGDEAWYDLGVLRAGQ